MIGEVFTRMEDTVWSIPPPCPNSQGLLHQTTLRQKENKRKLI